MQRNAFEKPSRKSQISITRSLTNFIAWALMTDARAEGGGA